MLLGLPRSVGVFEIKIAAQIEDFQPPIGGFPKGVFDFAPDPPQGNLNFVVITITQPPLRGYWSKEALLLQYPLRGGSERVAFDIFDLPNPP